MRILAGLMVPATMLMASGAVQAQTLPPVRDGVPGVVRVSDVGGPYAAMPPAPMSRDYGPPPQPYGVLRYGYSLAVLPLQEVYAIVRGAGFSLLGMPQQRGPIYSVAAIDPNGEDGRLVIDARSGDIIRFMPAYRLRAASREDIDMRYEPDGAPPMLPQYRRPPYAGGTPLPGPKVASRTPSSVPLPKRPPVRAVAAPVKPVAPADAKPVAVVPPVTPPAAAPVQQSAVTEPKVIEAKPVETTGPATAAPAAAAVTPPTVPAAPVEAKPAEPSKPADTPPPVQGLE